MSDPLSSSRRRWALIVVGLLALGLLLLELHPEVPRGAPALMALALVAGVAHARRDGATPAALEIDAEGVRRLWQGAVVEAVRWDELVMVQIATTSDGPYTEDFFFLLHAADGSGCAVPNALACQHDLFGRLQRLPGFDHLAVIAASGTTDDAIFTCWQGTPGDAAPCAAPPADEPAPQ